MRHIITFVAIVLLTICCRFAATAETNASKAPSPEMVQLREKVKAARAETESAKDAWDKARLETTLYDQRYKRAYKRWVTAKGEVRKKMEPLKEMAEIEAKLSIEKRKLLWNKLDAVKHRQTAVEETLKAVEIDADVLRVEGGIKDMENSLATMISATPIATPTPQAQGTTTP